MTTSRLRRAGAPSRFALLALSADGAARHAWADAAIADDYEDNDFAPPPGDPWYAPPPQQRGPRPNAADRLVFKMRIAPHWFDENNRFWYRNDLPGGAKEFILVDAKEGTRGAGIRPSETRRGFIEGHRGHGLPGRSASLRRDRFRRWLEGGPHRVRQGNLEVFARRLHLLQDGTRQGGNAIASRWR